MSKKTTKSTSKAKGATAPATGTAFDAGVLAIGEGELRATGPAKDLVLGWKDHTRAARAARHDTHLARVREAWRLKTVEKLTAAAIGKRMARDEGRPDDPYSSRQVRKWLAEARETL